MELARSRSRSLRAALPRRRRGNIAARFIDRASNLGINRADTGIGAVFAERRIEKKEKKKNQPCTYRVDIICITLCNTHTNTNKHTHTHTYKHTGLPTYAAITTRNGLTNYLAGRTNCFSPSSSFQRGRCSREKMKFRRVESGVSFQLGQDRRRLVEFSL